MTDSPPPRRGFPSAFAARPTRMENGGGLGREGDVPLSPRPLVDRSPPTDLPSTSTAPPSRRAFPSAFAPRPVPIEEKRRSVTPSPPSPSPSPEVVLLPSPAAAATPPPRRGIICPYPSNGGERHEIPVGEFHLHIIGCRSKHFMHPDLVQMTRCRYNGMHYIPAPELALHERLCRDDRRAQIEEQIKSDPIPVVVFEGSSGSESSSDDESYEMVEMPETTRENGEREQKKEEDRKEEEVVGEDEYGRVVDDLIQI